MELHYGLVILTFHMLIKTMPAIVEVIGYSYSVIWAFDSFIDILYKYLNCSHLSIYEYFSLQAT